MHGRDGLNADEKMIDSAYASMPIVDVGGVLVLTQKGLVFLEATGLLGTSKRRDHVIPLSGVTVAHIESRGFTGAFSGQVFLAIDVTTGASTTVRRYSCSKTDAERLCGRLNEHVRRVVTGRELRDEIQRVVKPKGQMDVNDVAKSPSVLGAMSRLEGVPRTHIPLEKAAAIVRDILSSLIAEGLLDGILESDRYISTVLLSRKTVQYHVTIDFTTIYSELKNKGIVLQTIECPSCKGKLEYPQGGSIFNCKYCGAAVKAMDVFEKFRTLLGM